MSPQEDFCYFVAERFNIYLRRKRGEPKPWSDDPVFRTTYFCNVRREDDKVTQWIRNWLNPYVHHDMLLYNMVMARFLNWPDTLQEVGFQLSHLPHSLTKTLEGRAVRGEKVWGNAYVITTHGIPMPKVQYLAQNVLGGVYSRLEALHAATRGPTLATAHAALRSLEGLGDFLAAQVVADLKNTPHHPLKKASDWWDFVAPGPGSIRGLSWFFYGDPKSYRGAMFQQTFDRFVSWARVNMQGKVPDLCAQDLQNCLCEFDKYMRVRYSTGRSKRRYSGGAV